MIFQIVHHEFNDLEKQVDGTPKEAEDEVQAFFDAVSLPSFAMGYVFGQMFDPSQSEIFVSNSLRGTKYSTVVPA
jgi:hypothetical protein